MDLKILSANVNGLGCSAKRRQFFNYLKDQRINVAMVQETHSTKNTIKMYKNMWGGKIYASHFKSKARGVAIMFDRNLDIHIDKVDCDSEGRMIIILGEYNGQSIVFINIYAPNEDNPSFFEQAFEKISNIQADHFIMGGDFNKILDSSMDRKSKTGSNVTKASDTINQFIENNDWVDIWRLSHPKQSEYTWYRRKPIVFSRLDYFLIPIFDVALVHKCEIWTNSFSDHSFVFLHVILEDNKRGPGLWKFNNSLLYDRSYTEGINEQIESMLEREIETDDPSLKWESVKVGLIEYSKWFSRKKAHQTKVERELLERKLKASNKRLAIINLNSDRAIRIIEKLNDRIDAIKEKLNAMSRQRCQGAMLRSRITWGQEAGYSSKYFLGLEKNRAKTKTMSAVKTEHGGITRNPKEILALQVKFYSELYTKDSTINFDATKVCSVTKLKDAQRLNLDSPLTKQELIQALRETKRGKTPGPDGLTADFYMMFFNRLGDTIYEAFIDSLNKGKLFFSARNGIITLIPKKGRNPMEIAAWRPICLLCADFKILSKALATRLKGILHDIIDQDQTGFVPSRNIATNVRKAIDLISYTETHNIDAVIISVDFLKAFDRVHYDSMLDILTLYNFGPYFISWVKLLFTSFNLRTSNAGFTSEPFIPTRGLFQGNPIASFLFVIIVEILAIMLRENENIDTIVIRKIRYLLSQFADDLDLFTRFNSKSINAVFHTLENFERISGMKVNFDKTTIYRIGSVRGTNAKFYTRKKIAWSSGSINMLGIWVNSQLSELEGLNYQDLLEKSSSITYNWRNRGLSLMDKIVIINSLIYSLFVYRMNVLPKISIKSRNDFNDIVNKFIWDGKTKKIPDKMLTANKEQGGLALVNIQLKDTCAKIRWVFEVVKNEKLKNLAYDMLDNPIGDFIWQTTLYPEHISGCFKLNNKFWSDVLYEWSHFNVKYSRGEVGLPDQILWYNSLILIENKPVFWNLWFRKGIVRISDLMNEDQKFLSLDQFQTKYGFKPLVTQLFGLLKAVSLLAKRLKTIKTIGVDDTNYAFYNKIQKPAKCIYRKINSDDNLLQIPYTKFLKTWESTMIKCDFEMFQKSVLSIPKLTIMTKFRSFAYKLLLSAVLTNVRLFHAGIKNTQNCDFCYEQRETYKHLFIECPQVKHLWKWIEVKTGTQLNSEHIILGKVYDGPNSIVNALILFVKYYIFRSKCLEERLSTKSLENYVKEICQIEEGIAKNKNKLDQHKLKWQQFY